nr:MAG TPA: hypothetical protein [Caudoviricetes sp.]
MRIICKEVKNYLFVKREKVFPKTTYIASPVYCVLFVFFVKIIYHILVLFYYL